MLAPLAGFGLLLAGLAALPFIPAEYWKRLGTIFGAGGDWTLGRRLSYNLIGVQLFAEIPIFGIDPGNFAERFADPEFRYYPGRTLLGRELHNMHLSVLTQYGIAGAAAFYGMLAALRRVSRNPASERMRIWAGALGLGFVAYLIASLFLPNEYTKYTWVLSGPAATLTLFGGGAGAANRRAGAWGLGQLLRAMSRMCRRGWRIATCSSAPRDARASAMR